MSGWGGSTVDGVDETVFKGLCEKGNVMWAVCYQMEEGPPGEEPGEW